MNKNLFWYKVGLAVIGIFVVGVAIFVMMQAGNTKKDADTDKAANKIADKLNSYIENNQTIPDTLRTAGVADVPATITYTKLGSSSYKFCVTYKANSSGFDATSAVLDATSGYPAGESSDSLNQSYTKYSLYIDPTHHKGENCQTIKPIIYQTNPSICNYQYGSSTSSNAIACPAINQPIYTPATNTSSVCAYNALKDSLKGTGCKWECTSQTQSAALRLVDAEVTKVSTGSSFSMTVKDTKGYSHVVTLAASGNVYSGDCTAASTSDIFQGDKVRIVVAGVNGQSVTIGDSNDNIAATEIDDFSD
ncbi:MAG TPA: hypothetical protein VLG47_04740 [Candidatus Saccharimonadales bacterium]|nr:hypothetical protein [Candidatus Saccharimonadales bacterium]